MGYDPEFLGGEQVPLPRLSDSVRSTAFHDGEPIDHLRHSLVFNASRGLAVFTAHNIDGASVLPAGTIKRRDRFRFDEKIPKTIQIDNARGYRKNPWDRGHLTRRQSLHWGSEDHARIADQESYFWTNIVPQHRNLHQTAWGPIESWMLARVGSRAQRAAVFQGPVLTADDPVHQNSAGEAPIQIPAGFWKVMVVDHQGGRAAATFLVWQRDHDSLQPSTFEPELEQVRLTTIEFLTGLSFPALRPHDVLRFSASQDDLDELPPGRPAAGQDVPQKRRVARNQLSVRTPEDIVL